MAYLIIKRKTKWSLVYRRYSGQKVLETRTVSLQSPEAELLGVFDGMSLDEAKVALQLNRADNLARYHAARRARLESIRTARASAQSAWLPDILVKDFERERLAVLGGRKDRWLIVKELLSRIDVAPYEWHWQPEIFWSSFAAKGWSLGYVRRLLWFINKWGEYYCRRTGKQWVPVSRPTGQTRSQIQRKHFEIKGTRRATTEMTPEHLDVAKTYLTTDQHNSLIAAFWLGLRKEELDFVLANPESQDTWYVDTDRRGFHVFHLLQQKLLRSGIEPRLCWKAVPLVEPEQQQLVEILKSRKMAAVPLSKLRREVGVELTNRSARKGFSIEMEARGYERQYVDDWLGHIGTSTASKSYRSRRLAMYAPPVTWKKIG